MRYELLHDSLAAAIYEMASAELKTYLQMREHIQRRYDLYKEGKSGLLTKEDLEYIRPYMAELDLENALNEFVKKSEAKLNQQKILRIAAVASIILLISILAIKSWIVSRHYEAQYLNARANQVLKKDPTVALRMSEKALSLNDNEIIKNDIYKIYRTRSFYHTLARFDGPVMDALVGPNNQIITILPNQNNPQIRNSNGELQT
ncbi:MAG: hypothetical protein KDD63_08290, partial [Bacteroidetes bacterium]|nr:hypothetical protein [Bacteroidota bacterium]